MTQVPPEPGSPLQRGIDAGGERWFLDGRPVHAGTELHVLCASNYKFSEHGEVLDFDPLWVPIRIEYSQSRPVIHWPTHGTSLTSELTPEARFRWPPSRRDA